MEDYDPETSPFEVEEIEAPEDGGKYTWISIILKHKETGKFYSYDACRSGSWHQGYDYEFSGYTPLTQVTKVPVTTYEWRSVNA